MSDHSVNMVNLASERVGASVLAANDDFFAAKENLIRDPQPVYLPDKYVSTGKWMDGWETRRRREPGHDWCLVRLGLRGVAKRIVVDTSYFRGNYPEHCLIEACDLAGQPGIDKLQHPNTRWAELVPRSPLAGDSHNAFAPALDSPITHVRLRIFPDGGVARLRVYGDPTPDWDWLDYSGGLTDLAAVSHGGRIIDCSDSFFGSPLNLIMPGRAANMGEGWETRRRRGPGHDWVLIELGTRGEINRIEVDTSHFKGNCPGSCSIEVADVTGGGLSGDTRWRELLPRVELQPHNRHLFQDELVGGGAATHSRLNIVPDGGVARLRLFGRTARSETLLIGLVRRNALPREQYEAGLRSCCGSSRWVTQMADAAPYSYVGALIRTAERVWWSLDRQDWLEAFATHPKIGEDQATGWSQGEQSGVRGAQTSVLAELVELNRAYQDRFGYIYIVCATGKSAQEMLEILRERMTHDPKQEIRVAADEQRKITRLRLEKWLSE